MGENPTPAIMKTSHTSKSNYPRRKPIPGLTPPEVIEKMAREAKRGNKVRRVRDSVEGAKVPVLPEVWHEGSEHGVAGGKVGAPGNDDGQRAGDPELSAVSDNPRKAETGSQLSRVLKRMLGETPPVELLDTAGIGTVGTNAEALAAVVMRAALAGKQWAVEMIRDQSEGKPVRAAQINTHDEDIEDMLDRASTARLNEFAKGKK